MYEGYRKGNALDWVQDNVGVSLLGELYEGVNHNWVHIGRKPRMGTWEEFLEGVTSIYNRKFYAHIILVMFWVGWGGGVMVTLRC